MDICIYISQSALKTGGSWVIKDQQTTVHSTVFMVLFPEFLFHTQIFPFHLNDSVKLIIHLQVSIVFLVIHVLLALEQRSTAENKNRCLLF